MRTARAGAKVCVLAAGLCLLAAVAALPQAGGGKTSDSAEAANTRPAATAHENKPKLAEITRVSTNEAARGVARQKAAPEDESLNTKMDGTGAPAVTELKPTTPDSEVSRGSVGVENSKDSKASKVHGRAYGSLDPRSSGDHQEGAAVGVGSKSGRTNIYIETERSRGTTPPNR